ncbi:MAG TPA: TetR/AcrR family transcriptional regulator, partial [Saprospiraceae bacterium]|nr:TetR/AcrR family transcriptional regulator [Saprospiraceae bacterium]
MELKQRIINNARTLFLKRGIKGVTMDNLARHLGISKKTLYQHFDNKEHLIGILLQSHLNEETRIIRDILVKSTDAIDEFLKIGTYVLNILRELPSEILFDLQKYYS